MAGYNNFYNQGMFDQLIKQKDRIENMLSQFQTAPVQNIINTNGVDFEARELNPSEDVANILVQRKTLFIDETHKKIYVKELNGEISKTYDIIIPKDEKDIKIEELEDKIKNLEAIINVKYAEPNGADVKIKQCNEDVEQQSKGIFKSVPKSNK